MSLTEFLWRGTINCGKLRPKQGSAKLVGPSLFMKPRFRKKSGLFYWSLGWTRQLSRTRLPNRLARMDAVVAEIKTASTSRTTSAFSTTARCTRTSGQDHFALSRNTIRLTDKSRDHKVCQTGRMGRPVERIHGLTTRVPPRGVTGFQPGRLGSMPSARSRRLRQVMLPTRVRCIDALRLMGRPLAQRYGHLFCRVAQPVELAAVNRAVAGSSPALTARLSGREVRRAIVYREDAGSSPAWAARIQGLAQLAEFRVWGAAVESSSLSTLTTQTRGSETESRRPHKPEFRVQFSAAQP